MMSFFSRELTSLAASMDVHVMLCGVSLLVVVIASKKKQAFYDCLKHVFRKPLIIPRKTNPFLGGIGKTEMCPGNKVVTTSQVPVLLKVSNRRKKKKSSNRSTNKVSFPALKDSCDAARAQSTSSQGSENKSKQRMSNKKRNGRNKKKSKFRHGRIEGLSFELASDLQSFTKIQTPLPKFDRWDTDNNLYDEFHPFVLTKHQLSHNSFPGHGKLNCRVSEQDKTLRHCTRCGTQFNVSKDGEYSSDSTCFYHPKKLTSYQGIPGAGSYLCCGANFLGKGCREWPYHVSAERFVDGVAFSKIRRKRQVRGGHSRSIYALDCEMSYTTAGLEVTKIAVVGLDGLTVYETFVLPEQQVLDYNSEFSGVTASDLQCTQTTIEDVREFLLKLLNSESILVGHALENDLKALRLIHDKVVDTSVVFPHMYGGRYKRSLKSLAEQYLSKELQSGTNGHDCGEDARTCLQLMLLKVHSQLKEDRPDNTTSVV